jgi:hypothetical protein
MIEICNNGTWEIDMLCSGATPVCYQNQCVVCPPNQNYCVNDQVWQCNAQGTSGQLLNTCDTQNGQACVNGACVSLCDQAATDNSYIGCEYWPTPTANPQLDGAFANDFAVAVHNANAVAANITITKGGQQVANQQVPPGEIQTIQLAFDSDLYLDSQAMESVLVPNGAYRLVSTVPVTVYQFNPLNYQLNSMCEDNILDPGPPCFSHTNDAALLLPTHVLSTNYMVMARPTFGVDQGFAMAFIPGFFAVVATQDNTVVTINFSANTEGGAGVGAFTPGQQQQFQLNTGNVLQIISGLPTTCPGTQTSDDCNGQGGNCTYCDAGPQYDLSGTVISATAPVAVFAGHVCSFVPYNFWACDHLEEQMIPSEAWGKEFIAAHTEPQSPTTPEGNVYKILSRDANNAITFYPNTVHQAINLNAGEYVEFQTSEDFQVISTQPMMVAQFTVGQNFYTNDLNYHGDPAFALVVPFEQYRDSYSFLTPDSITYNYVTIIAEVGEQGQGAIINLDGQQVSFANVPRIGNSQYGAVRVDLSSSGEYHTITGNTPFGIMVYGFARYTSYFYPGGLNLAYLYPVR